MNYEAVVEELYQRHRSVRDAGFSGEAYKPGLEAMRSYAAFIGNPERRFRSIHVAGTNGKGSVCSMIAAALASRGLRVGLYTSPHLVDFRERIKIVTPSAGLPEFEMIPEEAVCRFLELYDRDGLTFFEVTTAMAMWWFAESGVDVAVIETGLGGRLDSTNIIVPVLSVITSIGLDHCDLLGSTRAEIAAEKAGIFKPGVPALVWGRDPETQPVFERVAASAGSPLFFAEDWPEPPAVELDLAGPCQDGNLRTALAALDLLKIPVADCLPALAHAARITGFRGRWEVLLDNPLIICDIGHNPPAIKANCARLAELKRPLIIVYGAMADKDVDSISHYLPQNAEYYLVQPATPRAMSVGMLALKLKKDHTVEAGTVAQGVEQALERAQAIPGAVVFIGGSTFVVSEAIKHIEAQ